jgi:hypothetical protein
MKSFEPHDMTIEIAHEVGLAYFGRGLTDEEFADLRGKVIDTTELQHDVILLNPSVLSMRFPRTGPGASVPNAAVCLEDMAFTLGDAEYALQQAYLALHVFRKCDAIEPLAVSMARFYVSDVAMRLYGAGEHAAAAILDILGISEKDLADSGTRTKGASRQSKVAGFLKRERSTDPLTTIGETLRNCPEFLKTLNYRGKLTHHQPTTLAGVGIVYRRQASRWKRSETKEGGAVWQVSVGGGDAPETTVDQVLQDAQRALVCFHAYATALVNHYFQVLESHGITIDRDKRETSLTLFGSSEDTDSPNQTDGR